jgi:hypothetical protein
MQCSVVCKHSENGFRMRSDTHIGCGPMDPFLTILNILMFQHLLLRTFNTIPIQESF